MSGFLEGCSNFAKAFVPSTEVEPLAENETPESRLKERDFQIKSNLIVSGLAGAFLALSITMFVIHQNTSNSIGLGGSLIGFAGASVLLHNQAYAREDEKEEFEVQEETPDTRYTWKEFMDESDRRISASFQRSIQEANLSFSLLSKR